MLSRRTLRKTVAVFELRSISVFHLHEIPHDLQGSEVLSAANQGRFLSVISKYERDVRVNSAPRCQFPNLVSNFQ